MTDVYSKPLLLRIIGEFIGTCLLTISVAFALSGTLEGIGSIINGAVLLLVVLAMVPISGANLNPAVSFGVYVSRNMKLRDVAGYITAQMLGALLGMVIVYALKIPWQTQVGEPIMVLIFETLGAMVFGAAYGLALYHYVPELLDGPAVAIGLLLGMGIGSISGSSFINPALAVVFTPHTYVLFLAPIIGFPLGLMLMGLFKLKKNNVLRH